MVVLISGKAVNVYTTHKPATVKLDKGKAFSVDNHKER
jgi:hypothetical protein